MLLVPILIGAALLFVMSAKKPAPGALPPGASTPVMTERLKQRIAAVLKALNVDRQGNPQPPASKEAIQAATALAAELEEAGFPKASAHLRYLAKKAAVLVPPPTPAQQIPLPAGLSAQMRAKIQRAIQLERDPKKLQLLVVALQKLPPSVERDGAIATLQMMIKQILLQQAQQQTLETVEEIIVSPGIPQITPVAPIPPTLNVPPLVSPIIDPIGPITFPTIPIPQVLPAPKNPTQILASQLATHFLTLQGKLGMPKAKKIGKQNWALIKKFQQATGSKVDGFSGPGTFLLMAKNGVTNLPLVMYWPRGSTAKAVHRYREAIKSIAKTLRAVGNAAGAQELEASANRERGQGGIAGTMPV